MRAFCCTLFSRRPDRRAKSSPPPIFRAFGPGLLSFSLLFAGLVSAPDADLFADGRRTYESSLELPAAQKKLEELLRVLDKGRFYYEKETGGYEWRVENKWYSPFDYQIYGGYVSKRQPITLIRIEGNEGDVLTLSRILYEEKFFLDGAVPDGPLGSEPLGAKYHVLSQPINLLAPWLGVLYNSYGSPRLTTGQTWWRFFTYLFFDAFFIYAGGTNWFQQGKFEPQEYADNIAAGLAVMRAIGAYQSMNLIRGHNRVAELKYTFPITD